MGNLAQYIVNMKKHLIQLVILFSSTVGFTQTDGNEVKDSLFIQTHIGLMGRWQSGNLKQLNVMPNGGIKLSNSVFYSELNAIYNYLKIGEFNPVNDFWINGLYQYKPNQRIFAVAHTTNGFAKSYRIDYSSLTGAGIGLNVVKKSTDKYFQAHLITGYLHFKFENELAHKALGFGSIIRMSLPLAKQINVKWELSSYHSSKDATYWGGGNLLQLDFKINKRLFADIRHQVFFNQKNLQNIEKYNSILMFGFNYLMKYK